MDETTIAKEENFELCTQINLYRDVFDFLESQEQIDFRKMFFNVAQENPNAILSIVTPGYSMKEEVMALKALLLFLSQYDEIDYKHVFFSLVKEYPQVVVDLVGSKLKNECLELLKSRQKIKAIKYFRTQTRCSLKEGKEKIDKWEKEAGLTHLSQIDPGSLDYHVTIQNMIEKII